MTRILTRIFEHAIICVQKSVALPVATTQLIELLFNTADTSFQLHLADELYLFLHFNGQDFPIFEVSQFSLYR